MPKRHRWGPESSEGSTCLRCGMQRRRMLTYKSKTNTGYWVHGIIRFQLNINKLRRDWVKHVPKCDGTDYYRGHREQIEAAKARRYETQLGKTS